MFHPPQQFQDDLLVHEQGHHDITALMARDLFIGLMALKSKTYMFNIALTQDVEKVQRRYAGIQNIEMRYEDETKNGQRGDPPRRWNGFIQAAFTQTRQPPELAPDGLLTGCACWMYLGRIEFRSSRPWMANGYRQLEEGRRVIM